MISTVNVRRNYTHCNSNVTPDEYLEFVKRAKPLRYRKTFIGEKEVTRQYNRMSNLTIPKKEH